jgi:hypothetical protein
MNIEEHYEALRNRYQCAWFEKDKIPDRELINKILEESLQSTPVFSNIYNHEVLVYGPEYELDKRQVCLQTVNNISLRQRYDYRSPTHSSIADISALNMYLEEFESYIESGLVRKHGNKGAYTELTGQNIEGHICHSESLVTFNTQVMAPYLLVFRVKRNHFDPRNLQKEDSEAGMREKAQGSAVAQAYSIAIIARHYGIDAGFCGCFILNRLNVNRIFYNNNDVILFVGLGYTSENCYESPGSMHREHKLAYSKPTLKDIVTWK